MSEALTVVQSGSAYMARVRAGLAVPPGRERAAREEAEGGGEVAAAVVLGGGVVDVVRVRAVERMRMVVRGCMVWLRVVFGMLVVRWVGGDNFSMGFYLWVGFEI